MLKHLTPLLVLFLLAQSLAPAASSPTPEVETLVGAGHARLCALGIGFIVGSAAVVFYQPWSVSLLERSILFAALACS